MTQKANTFDSYDYVNSIAEDISSVISNVTPHETPFYTRTPKTTASSTLHEFLTSSLRSSGTNAHIEGDETSAEARTQETRNNNRTQIFKNSVLISDTDEGLDNIGKTRRMAYELIQVAREQKLDIEKALFANNAKVAGNATTARELAGAPAWMITNVNFVSASSGANATGDGSDARTDSGAPTAFSQAKFDDVMQSIWENGGIPDTCYLSSFQMNKAIAGFAGNNNQRANVVASEERVVNSLSVYLTPWGQVAFQPSRENRSRDVFILQDNMWEVATLRPTKNVALAKTGDSSQRQITTELTLVCKNEKASGMIADNTTS
jgi:hypothetical protein